MLTIKASADQVAELPDGRIIIAKPGELDDLDQFLIDNPDLNIPPEPAPPADLVAVTEPCQTCGGYGGTRADTMEPPEPCEGCHAGHPLFDLKVEVVRWATAQWSTERPGHIGVGAVHTTEASALDHPNAYQAVRLEGHITHAGLYVPGPLLPIVDETDILNGVTVPMNHIIMRYSGEAWLSMGTSPPTPIDLPTGARPGWFAVIAERSET